MGGSEHFFVVLDLNVLVEGLGGHGKGDRRCEEREAAEGSGVQTIRGNRDDAIEDAEFEFGEFVELLDEFEVLW